MFIVNCPVYVKIDLFWWRAVAVQLLYFWPTSLFFIKRDPKLHSNDDNDDPSQREKTGTSLFDYLVRSQLVARLSVRRWPAQVFLFLSLSVVIRQT